MFDYQHNADDGTKNPNKKILKPLKSDCRNSPAEICRVGRTLEAEGAKRERIERFQKTTSPINLLRKKQSLRTVTPSPTLSDGRPRRALLHPEHANLLMKRRPSLLIPPLERYALSLEEDTARNGGFATSPLSSSGASSIASTSNGPTSASNAFDHMQNLESHRNSTMTNKYSLLDALDLDYALLKAAAKGSIGPYSMSQSLQKLTFTQSLAFPALARGISNERNSSQSNTRGPLDPLGSGVNAFAKVATVSVLMLISVLVFGVLYKFIRT